MKPGMIYIAGYGRSGSTILDVLLGNHPDIFGAGELNKLFVLHRQADVCSCGSPLRACEFWRAVLDRAFGDLPGMTVEAAGRLTLARERWPARQIDGESGPGYTGLWSALLEAILTESGKNWVVDSSKSGRNSRGRIGALTGLGLPALKVVHLVRDPRAVMRSVAGGSNRKLEAGRPARFLPAPARFRVPGAWRTGRRQPPPAFPRSPAAKHRRASG